MTTGLDRTSTAADAAPMDGLLAAAREALGMELAYLAELDDRALILRGVDGDRAAFGGVAPGFTLPRDHSWCHAMVAGEVPRLVTDAQASAGGRRAPVRRRDRDPRLRRRPRRARRRLGLRLALLPQPAPAPRPRRARPALPLRARADRRRADRAGRGREPAPPRGGRGGRRPGPDRRAQRARELHRRALGGGAGARARGRHRAGDGRATTPPRSARSRCCTTSARSACRTRSCASPAA